MYIETYLIKTYANPIVIQVLTYRKTMHADCLFIGKSIESIYHKTFRKPSFYMTIRFSTILELETFFVMCKSIDEGVDHTHENKILREVNIYKTRNQNDKQYR